MAAVPITINGVICDLYGRTITGPVKIVGEAMLTGLGVGGGPIIPDQPPGVGIWPNPPEGIAPHPEHPIVLPDPPTEPPTGPADSDGFIKPPPSGGGWGYHETYQWLYDPPPGSAQPKA